jgi:molybdenum cofactor synthesis domain-containing protein
VATVISLSDAQRIVLDACGPLVPTDVDLADAVGLVLAADVTAAEDVPPFANSAVDGYAVMASDTATAPIVLTVVSELAAGATPPTDPIVPGEAIRIMTGAPMPPGADAVVMVEDSERLEGDRVRLSATVESGAAVRLSGSDVRDGEIVFVAGTVVTPAVAGVLASINARSVRVIPAATVAVLSTGDELVDDGRPLAPGQIRESNLTMLAPLLAEAGCLVRSFGIVPDDEAVLESVLRDAAATCDAIVTSGGVSMGDYDVVKAVLGRVADMQWMQVAIKPAKPFAFGTLRPEGGRRDGGGGVPVFGLPGNPVSSLVSFEMLARPALRRMMGHTRVARPSVVAVTDADLRRRADGKVHLVRVVADYADDGRVHVVPVHAQASHQLAATALANAIAVVDDGDGLAAGDEVAVLLLR